MRSRPHCILVPDSAWFIIPVVCRQRLSTLPLDERTLDSLASESPIMAQAKQALEILSREPSAQQIAELRREAEIARRLDRAEDRAEGRAEGRADGLREAIRRYCRLRSVTLDEAREARLRSIDEAELETLLEQLFAHGSWPE